jgi:hypothetical protein
MSHMPSRVAATIKGDRDDQTFLTPKPQIQNIPKSNITLKKLWILAQAHWYTAVISATQEAEIRRI